MRKKSGEWDLPGGKVDKGEKPIKALKREVLVETGLKFKRREFTYISSWIRQSKGSRPRFVIICYAIIQKNAGKVRITLSKEHKRARFMGPKKIRALKMRDGYKHAVKVISRMH